jgi:hypothetical protein
MRRINAKARILATASDKGYVEVFRDFSSSHKESKPQYLPLSEIGTAPAGFVSPIYPTGATQALSGTGALTAIDLGSAETTVNTTGAATSTMAAGTVVGQMKTIRMIGDIGDMVITVSGDNVTSITLNDVGDECTHIWSGTGWSTTNNNGCAIS